MKTFKLLIGALLLTTTLAAQSRKESCSPTIYYFQGRDVGSICEFSSPDEAKKYVESRNSEQKALDEAVAIDYLTSSEGTSQCQSQPIFVFAQKENRFSIAIGGFVNLRTSYDVKGVVENLDFITSDIPTVSSPMTRQQLQMDASTSRLYFKALANTRALGQVMIYMDFDMRGGESGSYSPRLRTGYASFLGFTLGRDVTTFCDLSASPQTIDFQGPNAYNYNYATLLRYERSICNERLGLGIAFEMPQVSGTYNMYFQPMPQRMPDIPIYAEYEFGATRQHHIRASAVFRDMYTYNELTEETNAIFGWGTQLSGNIAFAPWIKLLFNGVYGQGITQYIQDLTGSGLDFTPNPETGTQLQTMPMYGAQGSLAISPTSRMTLNGGYSAVVVEKKNGYVSDDEYKRGQYIFGNIFYSVTPRMQVACEYLFGSRENMDMSKGKANRVSLMAQYNF
ncbi:MAG: DcaP family trimeric outer membrane transporter [Rikenellaceae bacterium]